ncbi:MAG TPA: alanine--tRNA ligase [Patescibacteria group bacterium]|nr:alanine--tRNA ligase [Patescibacteria group bacterium]
MTAKELRDKYLSFFVTKDHSMLSSASLIPENDPTVLFTTAGMHPLVPYLLGQSHASGKRLVNIQKCIRTGDIDEVGDNTHNTFFEMLGNWSLGDYFKEEAIKYSYEFLVSKEWLGLDKEKIAVSVFKGDENAPFDEESYEAWLNLGLKEDRVAKLDKKENWWELSGENSPAGPDTEIFYWSKEEPAPLKFNPDDEGWIEIWNNVFMEYQKNSDGYSKLSQHNVDTGMGLGRTLAVLNNLSDVYKTELLWPIVEKIEDLTGAKYEDRTKEIRIIADHIRAATFILGDDKAVSPSNTDQGYVLRKLIRRALRYMRQLNSEVDYSFKDLAEIVIDNYQDVYQELKRNKDFIIIEIDKEEKKFLSTLEAGAKQIDNIKNEISGEEAFNIFQTFGYPVEMTKEIAKEKNLNLASDFDKDFQDAMAKHQALSRTASAGKFQGGLADSGEETTKLHTAAHLLLAALRKVLGDHVEQRGSNITSERLRFDFSHLEKLTAEQKEEVEEIVNEIIAQDLPVTFEEMTLEEARAKNAMGVFESKYGERVKVYQVGDNDNYFSREICGGPHVENTGKLGKFKIKKEESSSAGVRRIKAVLEG